MPAAYSSKRSAVVGSAGPRLGQGRDLDREVDDEGGLPDAALGQVLEELGHPLAVRQAPVALRLEPRALVVALALQRAALGPPGQRVRLVERGARQRRGRARRRRRAIASFMVTRAKGSANDISRSLNVAGWSPSTRRAAAAISSSVMAMTSSQSKQAV